MAFTRNHSASADGTFSATGATNWDANHAVSGATVGGIAYFPTATSEAMSGMTWNAGGAAGEGLAIAAGTATTNVQALSLTQTWNAGGVTFTGFKHTITDTASASGSLIFQYLAGSAGTTNALSQSRTGVLTINNPTVGTTGNTIVPLDSGLGIGTGVRFDTNFEVASTYGAWLNKDVAFGWNNNASCSAAVPDTALNRVAAGVVGVHTAANAAGTAGRMRMTSVTTVGVTVAALNAAPTTGEVQSVTDALAPVAGAAVAAGGAANALVWWNGAAWNVIGV